MRLILCWHCEPDLELYANDEQGIDTAAPVLQIGEYTLYGQLEETVGTNFFYDTTNRTRENKYQYVGQTTKKIKFTIAPPEP